MDKNKRQYIYKNLKKSIFNYCSIDYEAKIFIFILGFSFLFFMLMSVIKGYDYFSKLFFLSGEDLFMDFFNSVRDVSLGAGVYTERKVIYPPMANLIFKIFSKLTPPEYNATEFGDRLTWVDYPINNIFCFIFLLIPILIFTISAMKNMNTSNTTKGLVIFFLIFNAPMLFLFERGNILLYSVIFVFIYVVNYNSENKIFREIGLLALAFSFSIKLYPAILGWKLIADKRWKDAIRCSIYALILLILPSFFFGGISCIFKMFSNIFSFNSSSSSSLSLVFETIKIPENLAMTLYRILFGLAAILWIALPFLNKSNYKFYTYTMVLISILPSLYSQYAFAWFIPTLFLFCNKECRNQKNNASKFLDYILIALLMFPFTFSRLNTYVKAYYYIVLLLMLFACMADAIIHIVAFVKLKIRQKTVSIN